ncbi:hypothetical protein [Streptomyces sp. NPDC047315]|uniref:hypothetical protein n=1 Tax=Streptomyces sp. NPDC047315 TaxID=3155142 RepID=UPI0033FB70DD
MSLRKMFATAAVAAALTGAGLMAAPAAQAAPATGTASAAPASDVQPLRWVSWGSYSSLGACAYAGQWAVMNAGASYFDCAPNAFGGYDLSIWRP